MTQDEHATAYTRCEHCSAVLPVLFAQLAEAGGMIRCGSCGRTLNALARLYPTLPEDEDLPVEPTGMPPLLQPHVEQEQIIGDSEPNPDDAEASAEPAAASATGPVLHLDLEPDLPPRWARFLWPTLALALVGALALQLIGPDQWRVDLDLPGLRSDELAPIPNAVQLVSRDMHDHPSLDDAVVISAVMVNRAAATVPWPHIEVRLFDASQQAIGQRRLTPTDYLAEGTDIDAGLASDLRVPLVLEMAVAASRPEGFSMSFHYDSLAD